MEGQWYNLFMEGRRIAMAPPLAPEPGQILHADGTESTQASAARDVAAFLDWAAEQAADDRLRTDLWVLLYLGLARPGARDPGPHTPPRRRALRPHAGAPG